MGFWERAFASSGSNYDSIKQTQRQASQTAKRQYRDRNELKRRLQELEGKVADLKREVETQADSIAEQSSNIDRLTRCLLNSDVIEPADLAAVLPSSGIQDSETEG